MLLGMVVLILVIAVISPKKTLNQSAERSIGCTRTRPFAMRPEFLRALSLIKQRVSEQKLFPQISPQKSSGFYNCLDIQYKVMDDTGTEGYFIFDTNSDMNDLHIYVSTNYYSYDDLLTALLLVHEITHVTQFVRYKMQGESIYCYDKEVEAFEAEQGLFLTLNSEESDSIFSRLNQNPDKNSAYVGLQQLIDIFTQSIATCGASNSQCVYSTNQSQLKIWVENNPYYQQECSKRN